MIQKWHDDMIIMLAQGVNSNFQLFHINGSINEKSNGIKAIYDNENTNDNIVIQLYQYLLNKNLKFDPRKINNFL